MQNSHDSHQNGWNSNGNNGNGNHDSLDLFKENEQNSLKEILISKNLYPGQSSEVSHEITSSHSHGEKHIDHSADAHASDHGHDSHGAHGNTSEEKQSEIMKYIKPLIFLLVIIILLIASIAIVRFVPKAISGATTYFSTLLGGNKVSFVDEPNEIASGEKLTFKWKNPSTEEGTYFWSFACTPGLTVFYDAVGGDKKPVVCGTSFPLPNVATGEYGFYVSSNSASKLTLPMTISFFDKNQEKLISSDTEKVSVVQKKETETKVTTTGTLYNPNYEAPVSTTTPTSATIGSYDAPTTNTTKPVTTTNTGSYSSAPSTPTYYGNPDLSISLVQASVMNTSNAQLRDISGAQYGDRVLVRLRVKNTGTSPSGTWGISSILPTANFADKNFSSLNQPSLRPGDVYEMTMGFDQFDGSANQISITLISSSDLNAGNNTLLIPVPNVGSYSNNNYNYNGGYNYNYSTGKADLKVRILAVGTLNGNSFRETNNIDNNDTVGVRFEVENTGGESTGTFEIEVRLPNDDNDNYQIKNVSSFAPGERRVFLVGIDDPKRGKQTLTVEVDSDTDVKEKSESNNEDSERVEIDN